MKKQYLQQFSLLVLSLFSLGSLQAQIIPEASNLEYYEKYYAPISGLYAHFDFGLSTGVGQWGAAPLPSDDIVAGFLGEGGMGGGTGFHLAFGQMVPLSFKVDYADSWYSGINWGVEIAEHGAQSWDEVGGGAFFDYSADDNDGISMGRATNASILLGFYESYNVGNRFVLEGGIDLHMSIFTVYPNLMYFGLPDDIRIVPAEAENGDALAWQPGYSFHLAYRARNWRFYLEYYTQGINHYYELIQEPRGSTAEPNAQGFNADFNVSTLRFGISYLFMQI